MPPDRTIPSNEEPKISWLVVSWLTLELGTIEMKPKRVNEVLV